MNPADYLLPLPEIDWALALEEWRWLVPPECLPRHVTCFGDLFLVRGADVVLLDLEHGTLERYCDVQTEITDALAADEDADLILYSQLVDELAAAGSELTAGRCYHFRIPTLLGGEFAVSNIGTNTIDERIRFCGDLHRQIKELPDGASVELKFTDD